MIRTRQRPRSPASHTLVSVPRHSPEHPAVKRASRLAAHAAAANALAVHSDRHLAEILAGGRALGTGIGGATVELEVEGVRVFAKKIPLTDVEMLPEHRMSTANLFVLPEYYQYPMGSAGFGAWRELAAHAMTTNWVLTGGYQGFPLMYHWRILPGPSPLDAGTAGFTGVEDAVSHWDGSTAVRRRLEAIRQARHSVVVFLEFIPHRLSDYLDTCDPAAEIGPDSPFSLFETQLSAGTTFLESHGFAHFDAHFANILTDGDLLYFADFGLATSERFDLSRAERRFLADHRDYDRAFAATALAGRLVERLRGDVPGNHFVRLLATGQVRPEGLSPRAESMVDRYATLAAITLDFHRDLYGGSKLLPWPAERIAKALAAAGVR
jgi:hypothetical protein